MPDRIDSSHLGNALELFSLLLVAAVAVELVLLVVREVLKRLGVTTAPVTWLRLAVRSASALFGLALALCLLLVFGLGWEPRWESALKLLCAAAVTVVLYFRARADLRALTGPD